MGGLGSEWATRNRAKSRHRDIVRRQFDVDAPQAGIGSLGGALSCFVQPHLPVGFTGHLTRLPNGLPDFDAGEVVKHLY